MAKRDVNPSPAAGTETAHGSDRCVHFVAVCSHCHQRDGLPQVVAVGEMRATGDGVDIEVRCRACGTAANLTIEETPYARAGTH